MAENTDLALADEDNIDLDEFDTGKTSKLGVFMTVIAALGIGGAVGFTQLGDTVGPILAERAIAAESGDAGGSDAGGADDHGESAAEADDGHGGPASGGGAGGANDVELHVIDNLVVNPAQSGGTRFLLASIAVQVTEAGGADILNGRDVELRDALILVLASKTVAELTDIQARAGIVEEIRIAVARVVGPEIIAKVFIPQFVIQ